MRTPPLNSRDSAGVPPPGAGLRRTRTLGVPVDACDSLETALGIIEARLGGGGRERAFLVTFVNPAAVAAVERDARLGAALRRFDMVLPDGIAMALATRRLSGLRAARISFDTTSLALPVLRLAADRGCRVALVGGRPGVARRAAEQLGRRFPELRIAGTWQGHRDIAALAAELRDAAPDVVVCGMGSGRQEELLLRLAAAGWSGAGFTCGGYLDQLAGGLAYYPAWIDRAQLRWLYRLFREPRRLWRRYLVDYGRFALRLGGALAGRLLPVPARREAGR
ncbi:WecB/TagA/CpsF family glycosyltransferase [Teichococcus rhizosphaerae]|uniref:WecB/TagA/CpsF family glycosyltransferase n=1 Tax=Teichococcus rhizosphaerae TaxID=1335062 RepID=UPI0011454DEE|nr:WecB/TagA/CpsF family glycosyltransferase [Pseudoroseomonas rhizosphaerae]